jgi:ORF6N domain
LAPFEQLRYNALMREHALAVQERGMCLIRGDKVMLASDLAFLYRVATGALSRAVRCNTGRFPGDFYVSADPRRMEDFEMRNNVGGTKEKRSLRFQFAMSKQRRGGRRFLGNATSEQGWQCCPAYCPAHGWCRVSIAIMHTFVRLREMLLGNAKPARNLAQLEKTDDARFTIVFEAMRESMTPQEQSHWQIGFHP